MSVSDKIRVFVQGVSFGDEGDFIEFFSQNSDPENTALPWQGLVTGPGPRPQAPGPRPQGPYMDTEKEGRRKVQKNPRPRQAPPRLVTGGV